MNQQQPLQHTMPGNGGGQSDPWALLAACPTVEVQEKMRSGEVMADMVGLDLNLANKYKVLDPNGVEMFHFIESTGCCTKQLKGCLGDCAAFSVEAFNITNGGNTEFLQMERPWTCTCCCYNRPVMNITAGHEKVPIGSIVDPFACCDLTFKLLDPQGTEVMQAKGGCCQWGLCCQCPCGPCKEVNFDIVDATDPNVKVGHITKQVPSCIKCCCAGDVDNYKIDFQQIQDPQWKAMVTSLAVFMDFRFFTS